MSIRIKPEILAWLRFGKQYHYVATECGYYSADVVASNGKKLIEVEIKISKADFKRDFTHKHKHSVYANPSESNAWAPHQMYFAVPYEMKDFALAELEAKNPNYGLIVVQDDGRLWLLGKGASVAKKAKPLHKFPVKQGVLDQFLARMSSDICHLHDGVASQKRLSDQILERAHALEKLPDMEPSDDN